MARFFSPDEERRLEEFSATQRKRAVYAQQTTAQQAAGVSAIAAQFPFMRPGVVVPAGLSGMTPEEAAPLAQAEAKAKSKSGFGWHSFGQAIKGGAAVLKGTVRGAFIGLDALPQTFQGAFRESVRDGNISGSEWALGLPHLAKGFQQTDLKVAHDKIQAGGGYPGLLKEIPGVPGEGTKVDYGSGFFAGGEVKKTQIQRALDASPTRAHGGRSQTMGRYLATQFTQPGSKQYAIVSGLVDAALVIGADPSTLAGGAVAKGIRQNKLYAAPTRGRVASKILPERGPGDVFVASDRGLERQAAGLIDGDTRKTILPERVGEWLLSGKGQKVVQKLVETNDPVVLRKTFGKQIDTETLVQLADARNADAVYGILGPKLGVDIQTKVRIPGAIKAGTRRRLEDVRLFQQMPGQYADLSNADDAVQQLDLTLANAKIPAAERDMFVADMMRADGVQARYKVLKNGVGLVTRRLIEESGDISDPVRRRAARENARKLTQLFDDYYEDTRKYFVNEIGENVPPPGVLVAGEPITTPSPHLFGELLNRAVPLPDAREIRRETAKLGPLLTHKYVKPVGAAADFISGQLFKRLVLLRPAYTVRVVGEEQIRLAAAGVGGAFVHPLSHIAVAVSGKSDSRTARALNKLPGQRTGRLETDLNGEALRDSEQAINAMSSDLATHIDRSIVRTKNWVIVERDNPVFAEAWSDELAELYSDPIAKRVANGGAFPGDMGGAGVRPGLDGIKDWFFEGGGQKFRTEHAKAPGREFLLTREGADAYVDSILQRVQIKTGGDPDLMSVVATGRFGGETVFTPVAVGKSGSRKHQKATLELIGDLARRAEDGIGPQKVKGQQMIHGRMSSGQQAGQALDKVTDGLFSVLMSRPTDFLSRSPAFRQFYYRRVEELIGFMTPEAQADAIRVAKENGVKKDAIRRMEQRMKQGSGDLTTEHADIVAKGYGLDETKKLLYDLHDRSQFFDITRLLFPFGEAWKEVMTTWARLGTENPVIVRRAGQTVEAARDADLDGDGQGFFYEDPTTGEEMVSIPLVGDIAEVFAGLPDESVKFEMTAKGANVFSQSIYPGFGPMVQLPASKFMPDDPDFDFARKWIIPYGATDTSGGILESFFPAWAKKMLTGYAPHGEGQERALLNATTEAQRVLAASGDYGNTPEEQERLLADSRKAASRLFFVRGLAQTTSPSAPMWEFAAKDKTGKMIDLVALSKEYRKFQDEDYRTATARFVEKFGEAAFLSTIGKSAGPSVSEGAYNWSRENPEAARAYKDVYGYFVGEAGDDIDLTAFQRQFDTGEREVRSPEEARQIADQRLGAMVFNAAKARVGDSPTKQQEAILRELKAELGRMYPGYVVAPPDLAKTPKLIKQAINAASNPAIAATEAGKGMKVYIQAREKALQAINRRGRESFSSPKDADIRAVMREIANQISVEYPDFANLYENLLSRELPDEEAA